MNIQTALSLLPEELLSRSGSIFYTGKEAFTGNRDLYLLGLNPGGNPDLQSEETIQNNIMEFQTRVTPWSAYTDASWRGKPAGTHGMQPRVRHLLAKLRMDPRTVPASNVIFVRTRSEDLLRTEKTYLLDMCWQVHQAVINTLSIKIIVCFGGTAGRWARHKTGSHKFIDCFVERNRRGWKSQTHQSDGGFRVITVTHPGRANWLNPDTDPSELVARAIQFEPGWRT